MYIKKGDYFSDTFVNCLEDFYKSQQLSDRTFNEYISRIRTITDYLKKDFLDIDKADAESYFASLENKNRNGNAKYSSIYAKRSCFNKIADFIAKECSYVEYVNPFKNIFLKAPTGEIQVNRIPTTAELDKILSSASSEMYYLIYALVYRVALSLEEILSLSLHNIVESNGTYAIHMPAKNPKDSERLVALPDDISALLLSFIDKMTYVDEKGHLFYNKYNNPLNRHNFYTQLKKSFESAGIDYPYTMKDLRSRSILDMITASTKNGAEVADVADYVGIKDLRLRTYIKTSTMISTPPSSLVNIQIKKYEESDS